MLQAIKSGRQVPPRLLEPPPEVQTGLAIYMRAFFDLAADREQGGRIRWSTIRAWCQAHGIDGDDADDLHFLLGRMDTAYMAWTAEAARRQARDAKVKEQMRGKPG